MKILIVSDTHGHNELVDELLIIHKNSDIFLHAGDSEVPPHTLFPFRVVKGNCDYYFDSQMEYIIPTPFGNLLLRHKEDARDKYLKDNEIVFYVYGHTHVKACKKKNGICYINPGAICYPRDDCSSYAVGEINEEGAYFTFYRLEDHAPLHTYHVFRGEPTVFPENENNVDEEPTIEEIKSAIQKAVKEEIKNNKGE